MRKFNFPIIVVDHHHFSGFLKSSVVPSFGGAEIGKLQVQIVKSLPYYPLKKYFSPVIDKLVISLALDNPAVSIKTYSVVVILAPRVKLPGSFPSDSAHELTMN